jgi:hypothetical protein
MYDMTKQTEQFFTVKTYADGTSIAHKTWNGEQKARSFVEPNDKRFPPPTRERKALAESYVHAVMGKGILGLSGLNRPRYDIWSMGNEQERCEACETSNHWRLTHCRKCGEYIPRRMYMYSTVEWAGGNKKGGWKVRLGRDVTQTKKLNPMFNHMVTPPGVDRNSEAWICFVHAMHTISPVAFSMTLVSKPKKFSVSAFRTFNEREHMKATETLVNRYRRLVNHMQD